MYQAYMIRNDGKEIPVKIHPYGNVDDYQETLYASQWLYKNTKSDSTRKLILDFIKSFSYEILGVESDCVASLIEWADGLPYKVIEQDFITTISDEVDSADVKELDSLNNLVCNELNQEFMRVRLGGLVNSSVGSKELVFRISSVGFNWFNIIYMFVHDHKREISSVTIVKDEEATGYSDYFYKYKGEVYNQMPVDTFLEQSGNPVVEEYSYKQKEDLKAGKSILESFNNINYGRILEAIKKMHYFEVKDEVFVNG